MAARKEIQDKQERKACKQAKKQKRSMMETIQ